MALTNYQCLLPLRGALHILFLILRLTHFYSPSTALKTDSNYIQQFWLKQKVFRLNIFLRRGGALHKQKTNV
jgi:hypothetical protein